MESTSRVFLKWIMGGALFFCTILLLSTIWVVYRTKTYVNVISLALDKNGQFYLINVKPIVQLNEASKLSVFSIEHGENIEKIGYALTKIANRSAVNGKNLIQYHKNPRKLLQQKEFAQFLSQNSRR